MFKPILAYVGLRRPYRFERAIPALLAVLLSFVVVVSAAWLAAVDELTAGGPRAAYFLYLLVLLGLVIVLARWPWVAATLLLLALVDLVWGVGDRKSVV